MALFCGIMAVACIVYCLCVFFFMGFGTRFFLIWGVIGVGFGVLSFLFAHRSLYEKIPGWIRGVGWTLGIGFLLLLVVVEGFIFSGFKNHAKEGADYVIVLGAQWKTSGPSLILKYRLDKALDYLQENPDTIVIVSGGKGSNEPISEAEGMQGYLVEHGVDPQRILVEDQSTSTTENLAYSARLLEPERDSVVLISNNFHMFRALRMARKSGYGHVQGLAARSYPGMMPNNLLREFMAVVKDYCTGKL